MTTTLSAAQASPGVDANELRVTRVRALRGPNYWRLAPVIACDVRLGALEQLSSAELAGFTDRLLAALPTLREHPCTPRHGGRVRRAAARGDAPAARARARRARAADARRQRRQLRPRRAVRRRGRVVGDRRLRGGGRSGSRACATAARLVRACIDGEAGRHRRDDRRPAAPVRDACGSGRPPGRSSRRRGAAGSPCGGSTTARSCSSGSAATCAASRRRSPTARARSPWRSRRTRTRPSACSATSACPCRSGDVVRTIEDAVEVAEEIGFPVILKPLDASHGRGISRRIDDEDALRARVRGRAAATAAASSSSSSRRGATTACSW